MELAEWLKGVNVQALKAFAEDMPRVHDAPKKKVMEFILNDKEAREMAEYSKRIDETHRRAS